MRARCDVHLSHRQRLPHDIFATGAGLAGVQHAAEALAAALALCSEAQHALLALGLQQQAAALSEQVAGPGSGMYVEACCLESAPWPAS